MLSSFCWNILTKLLDYCEYSHPFFFDNTAICTDNIYTILNYKNKISRHWKSKPWLKIAIIRHPQYNRAVSQAVGLWRGAILDWTSTDDSDNKWIALCIDNNYNMLIEADYPAIYYNTIKQGIEPPTNICPIIFRWRGIYWLFDWIIKVLSSFNGFLILRNIREYDGYLFAAFDLHLIELSMIPPCEPILDIILLVESYIVRKCIIHWHYWYFVATYYFNSWQMDYSQEFQNNRLIVIYEFQTGNATIPIDKI